MIIIYWRFRNSQLVEVLRSQKPNSSYVTYSKAWTRRSRPYKKTCMHLIYIRLAGPKFNADMYRFIPLPILMPRFKGIQIRAWYNVGRSPCGMKKLDVSAPGWYNSRGWVWSVCGGHCWSLLSSSSLGQIRPVAEMGSTQRAPSEGNRVCRWWQKAKMFLLFLILTWLGVMVVVLICRKDWSTWPAQISSSSLCGSPFSFVAFFLLWQIAKTLFSAYHHVSVNFTSVFLCPPTSRGTFFCARRTTALSSTVPLMHDWATSFFFPHTLLRFVVYFLWNVSTWQMTWKCEAPDRTRGWAQGSGKRETG